MSSRALPVLPQSGPISSRRHPLVQRCRRLAAGRTDEDPAVLVDGAHLLDVALTSGWPIEIVVFRDGANRPGTEIGTLVERVSRAGIALIPVTTSVLEALSPVNSPSGVVAICKHRDWPLDSLTRPAPALTVATVDVQDPGNVGAIVRSADAFGATGVVCLGASAEPFSWKAVRGSMGSALRVPVRRERDGTVAIRALKDAGLMLVVAGAHDGIDADIFDWCRPTLLLMGSEGHGVPAEIARAADEVVSIPLREGVESLNVAVAAGVLLSRARACRERRRSQ